MQQELEVPVRSSGKLSCHHASALKPLKLVVTQLEPAHYRSVDAYVSRSTAHPLGMSYGIAKIIYEPICPDPTSRLDPELARAFHFKESYKYHLIQNAARFADFWQTLRDNPKLSVGVSHAWMIGPAHEAITQAYEEIARLNA